MVYQTLDDLKRALHDMNPAIPRFDCSCFDGDYVTGDIDEAYLERLSQKGSPTKAQAAESSDD